MSYIILSSDTIIGLTASVNHYLEMDYIPVGGVIHDGSEFHQAVYAEEQGGTPAKWGILALVIVLVTLIVAIIKS